MNTEETTAPAARIDEATVRAAMRRGERLRAEAIAQAFAQAFAAAGGGLARACRAPARWLARALHWRTGAASRTSVLPRATSAAGR